MGNFVTSAREILNNERASLPGKLIVKSRLKLQGRAMYGRIQPSEAQKGQFRAMLKTAGSQNNGNFVETIELITRQSINCKEMPQATSSISVTQLKILIFESPLDMIKELSIVLRYGYNDADHESSFDLQRPSE
ncbi:unnamed protein product [Menidia menidia]|uniref:(Atlantic silverside) hypothetical protein n=1 Tax=Menidia menidia TaxID=238744 RepID=A0A8S4BU58_9TELE|nr:unnamed protein product [Menidia menidia]